jgi:membrane protease YdiL (CAAX protease family)
MNLCGIFSDSKWTTKAILLLGIPFFLMIFSSVIMYLIQMAMGIESTNASTSWLLVEQGVVSTLTFIVGAFLYIYLTHKNPIAYLGMTPTGNIWLYIIASIAMFCIMPLVSATAVWNDSLKLPQALQELEKLMRLMEDTANDFTIQLMSESGAVHLFSALFVMAFIPALGEELLFRGCIQKGLENKIGNAHVAVWITAFIFSFIHFQFYGFLPRAILGVALGYFYVYGKSLWIPIWAHFLNNATSVLAYKMLYQETGETNLSTMGAPQELLFPAIAGGLLYAAAMLFFVLVARYRKPQ